MDGAYTPGDPSQYKSIAQLEGTLSAEQAKTFKQVAATLGIPAEAYKHLEQRAVHHMEPDGSFTEVSPEDGEQWLNTLANVAFGGDVEKAQATGAKARAYIEAALTPQQLAAFDSGIGATSLAWDPFFLNKFAAMYDAHLGDGQG